MSAIVVLYKVSFHSSSIVCYLSILFCRMSYHRRHRDNTNTSVNSFFLDEPCTKKELYGDESFGFCSMQGWRNTNEDFYKYLMPLDHHLWKHWAYFAIFDGHNGVDTAKNAAQLLDKYIVESFNE